MSCEKFVLTHIKNRCGWADKRHVMECCGEEKFNEMLARGLFTVNNHLRLKLTDKGHEALEET
jgi:hypothetical protein